MVLSKKAEDYLKKIESLETSGDFSEDLVDKTTQLVGTINSYLFRVGEEEGLSSLEVVSVLTSLLINHLLEQDACPGCEFWSISDSIHSQIGCLHEQ